MMTGDASINRDAPIICCTAEILANLALRDGAARVDYVVMDEFHYYADRERGVAWQIPLLALRADDVPADVGHARRHARRSSEGLQRDSPGARSRWCAARERPVPLDFEYRETPLHETIDELVDARARADLPRQLHAARRRRAGAEPDERRRLHRRRRRRRSARRSTDVAFDTPYGKEFQRFLRHGIGLHHAGLLPQVPPAGRAAGADRGCSRSSAAPTRSASASTSRSAPCCSPSSASSTARRPASSACATSSRSPGAPGARASTSAATWWRRRPST